MNLFKSRKHRNAAASNGSPATTAVPSMNNSMEGTRGAGYVAGKESSDANADSGKIPHLTLRTIVMATLVAMGGFIFGRVDVYSNSSSVANNFRL
jgi:hypothetical protein